MNLAALDRRWIFLIIFVAVALPLLFPIGMVGEVSPGTQTMYDLIDALPEGATVILSFDCEASSWPEIGPIARALAEHTFARGVRVVGTSFLSEGTELGYQMLRRQAQRADRVYGTDWVYLGFRPQYVAAMLAMGEAIETEYPVDYLDQPLTSLALMHEVKTYRQIAVVISIADDTMPQYWIEYAGARYDVPVAAALSAVMVTTFAPYLDSGQLTALLGGLKGAAEYERLLGYKGAGSRGMDAQSSAHMAIILLVIVGNIAYFRERRRA